MTGATWAIGRSLLAAVLFVVLTAGCVPASPDVDTYEDKVGTTVRSAVSEVRTVQQIVELLQEDAVLRPTAITQMRYSQKSLDTTSARLTDLNPPPARDGLNRRLRSLLGDGDDLIDETRTAIERRDRDRYHHLAERLDSLARDLERLEGRLS